VHTEGLTIKKKYMNF